MLFERWNLHPGRRHLDQRRAASQFDVAEIKHWQVVQAVCFVIQVCLLDVGAHALHLVKWYFEHLLAQFLCLIVELAFDEEIILEGTVFCLFVLLRRRLCEP